jgi:cytochrome c
MQILDNTCHPDARIEKHRAGDLYDLIACKYETVKAAGEWNKVLIRINDGHLEHWLNGVKVVETQLWTEQWNALVAKSKFPGISADFGKSRRGHISLQDHGNKVWFRNIKIRDIGKGKMASK